MRSPWLRIVRTRKSMKRIHHILILSLMLMPATASALTFQPPARDLTPDEKKVGSIYRGCNGFHCLEEESELGIALSVSEDPCGPGGMTGGTFRGEGYICLSVATNAREGIIVLMRATDETATCLDDAQEGMHPAGRLKEGCAKVSAEEPVMTTLDQVGNAFGRLKVAASDESASGTVRLMSVIAY